jgi:alkylated DNA repair protein (DNA oxidative demethylase)
MVRRSISGTPSLFDELPDVEGLEYEPEFISVEEEQELLTAFSGLEFGEVRMRGVAARRRVAQLGFHYSFESLRVKPTAPIPEFLLPLRTRVAGRVHLEPEMFAEALVTQYPPGAGIGWHRDAPPFGIVAGISLLSAATFRMRPIAVSRGRAVALELEPRSLYVLRGPARSDWQHSISPTKTLRYSITFRTLTK